MSFDIRAYQQTRQLDTTDYGALLKRLDSLVAAWAKRPASKVKAIPAAPTYLEAAANRPIAPRTRTGAPSVARQWAAKYRKQIQEKAG